MLLAPLRQILTNSARAKQDKHHRSSYPERTIKIRIAFKNIKKVCTRIQSCPTSGKDRCCVNIEELRVEGERPEKSLRCPAARRGVGRWWRQAGRCGGTAFGGSEVGGVEFEIFLEVGMAEVALDGVK